jgi:hypothetical protein
LASVGLAFAALAGAALDEQAAAQDWRVRSPDRQIEFQARTTDAGGLEYRVLRGRVVAVDWSQLGIVTQHADSDLVQHEREGRLGFYGHDHLRR